VGGILVKGGAIAGVESATAPDAAGAEALRAVLATLTKGNPLPRTAFLLADPGRGEELARSLQGSPIGAPGFSDEPLSVRPLSASGIGGAVSWGPAADRDLPLALLALAGA
jgi:hypothetical protein